MRPIRKKVGPGGKRRGPCSIKQRSKEAQGKGVCQSKVVGRCTDIRSTKKGAHWRGTFKIVVVTAEEQGKPKKRRKAA